MKAKIRVYGKDQNRTALGIINAYLTLNPNASLADLQRAFPYSLNPTGTVKETIVPISEAAGKPNEFFEKPDELITLKDGQKASLKYLWEKPNFEKIKEHAKLFGIEAADTAETPPFKEGSYKLELIEETPTAHPHAAHVHHNAANVADAILVEEIIPEEEIIIVEGERKQPQRPPVTHHAAATHHVHREPVPVKEEPKKSNNWWWWLLLLLLLLLLALLLFKKCAHKEEVANLEVVPYTATQIVDVYEPYSAQKLAEATVTDDGDLVYNQDGNLVAITIDDQEVSFDKLSTEAEIYAFLNSDLKESGWLVLDRVHFKFNEVNFTPAALDQIKYVTAILNKYAPNATLAIEGFADHIGTDKENQLISDERAVATKEHFVTDGFATGKITSATGLRDTDRLCQADDTPLCRAKNRRAEIKITK
ncbi:MAG: OmpA family protein [Candidatus Symbiothrix sp.]|jgi:outer membrane protein OmpA-like peptidoglycan-associated protein|nr:OmpA family protein [Candidatus Symbiothrix sp.]